MRGAMRNETGVPGRARRDDLDRAPRARPRHRARRDGRARHDDAPRAPGEGPRDRRLAARDARGAEAQVRGRARAARPGRRDRRRGLRDDLPDAPAGRARERDRRRRDAGAVRPRLRARRGDQRDLGRPLQPAPAHLLRPADPAGRPGLLRHHPLLHGLQNLLLPHVQRGLRDAAAARRLQAVPRVARQRDRARPPGRDDRRDRRGLADGAGDRDDRTSAPRSGSSSGTGSASGCTRRR